MRSISWMPCSPSPHERRSGGWIHHDKDGVEYLALGGLRGDHTDYDGSTHPIGQKVSDAEPQPTDDSKRTGIEVKVSFYYAGTDTPVPDTFKGLTGFGDLDGVNGTPDSIEGWNSSTGSTACGCPTVTISSRFDENGYGGSDEVGPSEPRRSPRAAAHGHRSVQRPQLHRPLLAGRMEVLLCRRVQCAAPFRAACVQGYGACGG